jgi:hypothetical protein
VRSFNLAAVSGHPAAPGAKDRQEQVEADGTGAQTETCGNGGGGAELRAATEATIVD